VGCRFAHHASEPALADTSPLSLNVDVLSCSHGYRTAGSVDCLHPDYAPYGEPKQGTGPDISVNYRTRFVRLGHHVVASRVYWCCSGDGKY
jgi:hypothetical protein